MKTRSHAQAMAWGAIVPVIPCSSPYSFWLFSLSSAPRFYRQSRTATIIVKKRLVGQKRSTRRKPEQILDSPIASGT